MSDEITAQTSDTASGDGWTALRSDIASLIQQVVVLKVDVREAERRGRVSQEKLLLAIIEVLDNFERVFANIEPRLEAAPQQAKIWVGNFRSVRRVLEEQLKKHGVSRIEAPNGRAVPGYHTIIDTRENLDVEDGTILEEAKKGYLWGTDVIRKGEVIVVKN